MATLSTKQTKKNKNINKNKKDAELEWDDEGYPKIVIDKRSVKAIFLEVETLLAINSMFLEQLEKRVVEWSNDTKIGDIFLSMMSFFKSYTGDVNHAPSYTALFVNSRGH